jgi:hypothetical protein
VVFIFLKSFLFRCPNVVVLLISFFIDHLEPPPQCVEDFGHLPPVSKIALAVGEICTQCEEGLLEASNLLFNLFRQRAILQTKEAA